MIYTPDPYYNPIYQEDITPRTRLAPGITMSRFLGGTGDRVSMNHLVNYTDRLALAKQYYLQAQVIRTVSENRAEFSDYRLTVVEGLYKPAVGETPSIDSINYFMTTGQAVVYELIDNFGNNAVDKTYDLALFLKENIDYEKMILDYDIYNPNETLNAQIVMIMPEVISPWIVNYQNKIETRFNNYVQSTNELVEILKE